MAQHRHKRETNARVLPRVAIVAAPMAVLATVSAVTLGVLSQEPAQDQGLVADQDRASQVEAKVADRGASAISRSSARTDDKKAESDKKARNEKKAAAAAAAERELKATRSAVRSADTKRWATTDLNLWTQSEGGEMVGVLDAGKRVLVTGREADGRVEVALNGKSRWVTPGYLAAKKPAATPALGGACSNGTSVPSGVSANVVAVHRAVCAAYPSIRSYGTLRNDGEHGQGRAIDVMVSGDLGWEIANFLRANAGKLGIDYLIYSQKIWSTDRGGEGWRGMSDRGSTTANHYDHVHVTVH